LSRIDPTVLAQIWVHSHEEDKPGQAVYRLETFAFPPSRGRGGFELSRDGTMTEFGPGPTDRTIARRGRWEVGEGGVLTLRPEGSDKQARVMRIAHLSPNKLVLEKMSAP
jgi:hypothetical protein